ncbi:enoyl-CoA hydratase-related protein [Paracoccus mutanolyticus]|uniref:enoyl-CoA hydratase-related protein n=1 Tax=Paracoccus mutanolyticus TaxID=1499308 RepID=UPI0037C85F6D
MAYQTLTVEIDDYVALIRLARPEALNALNSQLVGELAEALAEADRNDKVRCIVLTGSEKAFAAGADIKEMATKTYVDAYTTDLFGAEIDRITATRKPIIAAVAGLRWAAVRLAMACDTAFSARMSLFPKKNSQTGTALVFKLPSAAPSA